MKWWVQPQPRCYHFESSRQRTHGPHPLSSGPPGSLTRLKPHPDADSPSSTVNTWRSSSDMMVKCLDYFQQRSSSAPRQQMTLSSQSNSKPHVAANSRKRW
ncbi:hypothetical protein MLD38_011048 [Melastoma candidum]|uniref:Uncharacterized protein n=1 Tax=Melastoma candidum TaxID=119954 RepID=A0ACB9R1V6_9MYRT|nr:hypothetical protein MLD38_011048 [Melastoma candidum]